MTRFYAALAALLLIGGVGAPGALAQAPPSDPARSELSRQELESLLARYEETIGSPAYSSDLRARARKEADLIRARFANGDFQVGDQITLSVEGEAALTGNFTVMEGPRLVLPELGDISLRGILRSELGDHLQREIGRFVRDPVVQAQSSMRLMITGGVTRAGYHVLPTHSLLSDVVMVTGGPAANARLDRMYIERQGQRIWEGEMLQQALVEGRTLDQMSLRAGDHITVPVEQPGGGFLGSGMMMVTSVVALISSIATIMAR